MMDKDVETKREKESVHVAAGLKLKRFIEGTFTGQQEEEE
jgi:hypothetical protein